MQKIVIALIVLVGIIHLLPLAGIMGASKLASLYGITLSDNNLTLLMRHRAVLFGLLGVFMIYAAFRPPLIPIAVFAGLVSVLSFLLLAELEKPVNEALHRVVLVDWVAAICLVLAGGFWFISNRTT